MTSNLLRHKNLQATERYLQAIDPRFREIMRLLEGDVVQLLSEPFAGGACPQTYSPAYSPAQEDKTF